jgi:signal transduction histidine kinase
MEILNIPAINITVFVTVAIAAMLLLIISFLIAFNTSQRKKFQYQQSLLHLKEEQQNELIRAAVMSEETERHRISDQLHGEVGALLSATRLYLYNLHAEKMGENENEIFQKSIELLNESIQKVRFISHNLHSNVLREFGLNEAIYSFTQKLNQPGKLNITTLLDESYESKNPEGAISIYRILQELCGNIIKHSAATELNIQSFLSGGRLRFVIKHNGVGLTQQEFEKLRYEKKGLGLKNIQNRIILLKGSILFERIGDENIIAFTVPLSGDE